MRRERNGEEGIIDIVKCNQKASRKDDIRELVKLIVFNTVINRAIAAAR